MNVPAWFPGPVAPKPPDYSTEKWASVLCDRIMQVWRDAGHANVYAWTVKLPARGPKPETEKVRFGVRTNLVGGLPPGR